MMKKSLVFAALFLASAALDASALGIGAVQVPFDPDVGWVTINTTASGKLAIVAHLDAGRPDTDFSVTVRVRYEDGSLDIFPDVTVLSTNAEGKGTAFMLLNPTPPEGSTTLRRIAVRVRRAPGLLYLAVAWDSPLKPRLPDGVKTTW